MDGELSADRPHAPSAGFYFSPPACREVAGRSGLIGLLRWAGCAGVRRAGGSHTPRLLRRDGAAPGSPTASLSRGGGGVPGEYGGGGVKLAR